MNDKYIYREVAEFQDRADGLHGPYRCGDLRRLAAQADLRATAGGGHVAPRRADDPGRRPLHRARLDADAPSVTSSPVLGILAPASQGCWLRFSLRADLERRHACLTDPSLFDQFEQWYANCRDNDALDHKTKASSDSPWC